MMLHPKSIRTATATRVLALSLLFSSSAGMLWSCKSKETTPAETTTAGASGNDSQTVVTPPPPTQTMEQIRAAFEFSGNNPDSVLIAWSRIYSSHQEHAMRFVFADEVDFFGKRMQQQQLVDYYKNFFATTPDASMDLDANSKWKKKKVDNSRLTINFTRAENIQGSRSSINGIAELEKTDSGYKIIRIENVKDKDYAIYEKAKPMTIDEITSCETAAIAIFKSSDVVHGHLTLPDSKWKIEYRPREGINKANAYVFVIHNSKANAGKIETLGRYYVELNSGELKEENQASKELMPIPFRHELRDKLFQYCNRAN